MMRTSGRTVPGRLALALLFVAGLAGVAAAETLIAGVPNRDAYIVTAALIPGAQGAEVLADVKGEGHVNFRIGFGADELLSVNGAAAGTYDPAATYFVSVDCRKAQGNWFATTTVVNQSAGVTVFEQVDYAMPGAADEVVVVAEDVIHLCVH